MSMKLLMRRLEVRPLLTMRKPPKNSRGNGRDQRRQECQKSPKSSYNLEKKKMGRNPMQFVLVILTFPLVVLALV